MSVQGIATDILSRCMTEIPKMKPMAATYGHLLASALFPIYIGAHASLSRPESAARSLKSDRRRERKELRKKKNKEKAGNKENQFDYEEDEDGDDEEEEEGEIDEEEEEEEGDDDGEKTSRQEALQASDAILFPIMAGVTLSGLYFLIKWLKDPAVLNKFLGWYFMFAGLFSAIALTHDALVVSRSFLFPTRFRKHGRQWKVSQKQRLCFPLSDDGNTTLTPEKASESGIPASLSSPCPHDLSEKIYGVDKLWDMRNVLYKRLYVRGFVVSLFQLKARLTSIDIASFAVGVSAVLYFTFVERHWWLTNFMGFSFSYGALRFISPTTFTTASLILMSLFIYDIYFVFFTPLMVTVATKLDIPIKLLFPRPPVKPEEPDVSFAMLGLGDIVVPGLVVSLALRYDIFLFYLKRQIRKNEDGSDQRSILKQRYVSATGGWGERFWTGRHHDHQSVNSSPGPTTTTTKPKQLDFISAKQFPRTYFHASLIGYCGGLVTTLVAMHVSKLAQPALLYLVPFVLVSLWGTALVRGELGLTWNFSDAFEDEEAAQKRKEKEEKEKKEKEEKKQKEEKGEEKKEEKGEKDEKKEKKSARGLFSRLLFGDDEQVEKDKRKEENAKKKQERQKEARDHRVRDADELVGFMISLSPFRPKKYGAAQQKDEGGDNSTKQYAETKA